MDTANDIRVCYDEMWRTLTAEQRFLKGLDLIQFSHDALLSGFRRLYPALNADELRKKIVKQVYHIKLL